MPPALEAQATTARAHPAATVGVAAAFLLALRLARFFTRADADAATLAARAPRPGSLAGRSVWITGASQGLGLELALRYASLGAALILSARPSPRLESAGEAVGAAALASGAPAPALLPFDATAGEAELERVAAAANAACAAAATGPGPDLLVLCAGASQHAAAASTASAVSDAHFELN